LKSTNVLIPWGNEMGELTEYEQKPLTHQDRKTEPGLRTPELGARSGGDLFIVDNSDQDWKVLQYLREWALQEFFKGHEMTVGEWEQNSSAIYQVLDQYRKEGYQALIKNHRAVSWGVSV
jgi:hypothetical protein